MHTASTSLKTPSVTTLLTKLVLQLYEQLSQGSLALILWLCMTINEPQRRQWLKPDLPLLGSPRAQPKQLIRLCPSMRLRNAKVPPFDDPMWLQSLGS